MRGLLLSVVILFLGGCSDTPTPQETKEIKAKNTIEENISEAQRAKAEYKALQQKRLQEGIR